MSAPYSPEFRARALRMLQEARPTFATERKAVEHVAGLLGVSRETLRSWSYRYQGPDAAAPGQLKDQAAIEAEVKQLKKRITELEKANQVLREASVFFATELGRPSSK